MISFNNISNINNRTFSGLSSLKTLMLIKNKLTNISNDVFDETALQSVFLHSNAIKTIERESFSRLNLKQLTIFDNPLHSLPDGMFDEMDNNTKVSLTCKNLLQLPKGQYQSVVECAPSTSFQVLLTGDQSSYRDDFESSGFECLDCEPIHEYGSRCRNCSLCQIGYFMYAKKICAKCPAGGFYQDEMGQIDCKRCSIGTFVSEIQHPGTSSTDCVACPYGTLSNETAKYRACRCLQNFYRSDRFGPCSACPPEGFVCEKDTAILAPNYFWKWSSQSEKELYKGFVNNIHLFGPDYNKSYSTFNTLLPKPLKCPRAESCKGGIDSECRQGYEGDLCATCSHGFYFRFNSCLKCPRLTVTVTSSILVIFLFVAVFLLVLWGDSKRADNNRTVADVIMSCFKIVIGFYQVIAGIFSALAKVHWPVILISTEKFLKLFEGNILQLAPLSCIDSSLRLDQLGKFTMIIALNFILVGLICLYLFIKRRYITNKTDCDESQKIKKIKSLEKSCYRNIFLLLLTTYPTTSKSIIQILPLPGACEETCFTDDKNDCIFLLRADYSIHCFTPRHSLYWLMASILALYPVGFPLLALFLVYKYRKSQENEAIAFGLRVFFENYKKKFWFWEVTEMYRKLVLISLIFLFGSKSLSQISLTVLTVSVFGVVYTLFRPIKDKFEDRLQTLVLWIIFFDVCLGAVYTNWDESQDGDKNDSIFVNVLFVVLNASVLLLAVAKGILHVKLLRKYFSCCSMGCSSYLRQGFALLKNEAVTTTSEESYLIDNGT
ncbi:putative leucine-rich repeat-containing protein DDB_G0281931 isoform X1 [Stylophora pistillata]|uniref:putative leucine-rich repeat-containing protein DDB_G0281931 isoform X1 n=1 Tax=Stylophora pistillata TaxID=50429 RepID=UPI000C056877|nr:putative leucine-rich repeat-containing protein DDB_G0281931 isoform X1 [Stylophora pistillata]